MAELVWDKTGEHWFETGVDHGVLYPIDNTGKYGKGIVWNGLTAVNETPEGAEPNDQYADNIKYLTLRSAETFGATIEAFTYPEEFRTCDGQAVLAPGVVIGQQKREPFGFAYRTLKGNDLKGQDAGYILHLVYGCTVSPSERSYATVNDSPEAITFSWELDTTPVSVPGYKPTSLVTIDSTEIDPVALRRLEAILYGSLNTEPRLPLPDELVTLMETPIKMYQVNDIPDTETVGNKKLNELVVNMDVSDDTHEVTGTVNWVDDYVYPSGVERGGYIVPMDIRNMANTYVAVDAHDKTQPAKIYPITKDGGLTFVPVMPYNKDTLVLDVKQYDNGSGTDPTMTETYLFDQLEFVPTVSDTVEIATKGESITNYMTTKHSDKTVDDLQKGLSISAGGSKLTATGVLHKVEGFSSFYKPEKGNGHFMIFEMKPKDTTHRIGAKGSDGSESVFEANDFIYLIRVDDYTGPIELYVFDSNGTEKISTLYLDISRLRLE